MLYKEKCGMYTVNQNIIGEPKILNDLWCTVKLLISNVGIAIFTNRSSNKKVVTLILFPSFLYCFCTLAHCFFSVLLLKLLRQHLLSLLLNLKAYRLLERERVITIVIAFPKVEKAKTLLKVLNKRS